MRRAEGLGFLHSRLPPPGSHTFAGVSPSLSPPSLAPRAHTEVLRYRDWTPAGQGSVRGQGSGHSEEVRTAEETLKLKQSLMEMFPQQESVIIMTLQCQPSIKDINRLTDFILEQQEWSERREEHPSERHTVNTKQQREVHLYPSFFRLYHSRLWLCVVLCLKCKLKLWDECDDTNTTQHMSHVIEKLLNV